MTEPVAAPEADEKDPAATPPDPAPEPETVPKAEADALRRRVAEAEKAQRKLEADQKKAAEEQLAKEGQYKELAETRERERDAERAERARSEREQRITRIAGRLKFVDPSDVIGRVTADEGQEDATVEAALERIATQSPHLIAKDPAARPEIGQVLSPASPGTPAAPGDGKPAPPAGKPPLQSLEEFEALPQTERLARMDEADWLLLHEK